MQMQSALFMFGIFPPPSACSDIFAFTDGACTGLTTDAFKAFVVEAVFGYTTFTHVTLNLFIAKMSYWVEF